MIDRGKSIPHFRCVTVDITVVVVLIIRTPTPTLMVVVAPTSEVKRVTKRNQARRADFWIFIKTKTTPHPTRSCVCVDSRVRTQK